MGGRGKKGTPKTGGQKKRPTTNTVKNPGGTGASGGKGNRGRKK